MILQNADMVSLIMALRQGLAFTRERQLDALTLLVTHTTLAKRL